jgi:hypothetical protein
MLSHYELACTRCEADELTLLGVDFVDLGVHVQSECNHCGCVSSKFFNFGEVYNAENRKTA